MWKTKNFVEKRRKLCQATLVARFPEVWDYEIRSRKNEERYVIRRNRNMNFCL